MPPAKKRIPCLDPVPDTVSSSGVDGTPAERDDSSGNDRTMYKKPSQQKRPIVKPASHPRDAKGKFLKKSTQADEFAAHPQAASSMAPSTIPPRVYPLMPAGRAPATPVFRPGEIAAIFNPPNVQCLARIPETPLGTLNPWQPTQGPRLAVVPQQDDIFKYPSKPTTWSHLFGWGDFCFYHRLNWYSEQRNGFYECTPCDTSHAWKW